MTINLTTTQKSELRRLTQLANRRILSAKERYRGSGQEVLPREVAGDYQLESSWHTPKTPISRSIKFESMDEYRKKLKMLQRFDRNRPDIWTYRTNLEQRTVNAVETSIGEFPPSLMERFHQMSVPELNTFWKMFSDRAVRFGALYSSDQVMTMTLQDFFQEDMDNLLNPPLYD